MSGYRLRPMAGSEVMFELLDDGGSIVAFGYEAPLRLACDAAARTEPRCEDADCHGECRTHGGPDE